MPVPARAALRFALPALFALACGALAFRGIAPSVDVSAMARGLVGPTSWPKAMLLAAAAAAGVLALLRGLELLALRTPRDSEDPAEEYHEARSIGAIALVIGYGVAIPLLGFAWATPLFLAGWLLLGGLRRPLAVALVSILGTLGVLYFFVKLSLMPLDRGKGLLEQATVALYRVLGIY